jgi:hypothetical protein
MQGGTNVALAGSAGHAGQEIGAAESFRKVGLRKSTADGSSSPLNLLE